MVVQIQALLLLSVVSNTCAWIIPPKRMQLPSGTRFLTRLRDEAQSSLSLQRRLVLLAPLILSQPSRAEVFTKQTDQFGYRFQPPASCAPTSKPLKTHLSEQNWKCEQSQYGITVDPVRISSLQDFGTPEQVAAKVVLAEVNRDGVTDVQLMTDPIQGDNDGQTFYRLEYKSTGSRGIKRFVTKFFISRQQLYALTAQCDEEVYDRLASELQAAADSFQVL